ncbi:hypothetical protein JL09_g6051 [Pichia kudriavzevii]|uniref:Uncharacterized protein n=1 Tax=Pichia kudriavzevii TaxID=4909 RepID=A0A099NQJ3_PICKU|nr:hypothetical protein JL09_g6051 [Pichia kudriavzevii]
MSKKNVIIWKFH